MSKGSNHVPKYTPQQTLRKFSEIPCTKETVDSIRCLPYPCKSQHPLNVSWSKDSVLVSYIIIYFTMGDEEIVDQKRLIEDSCKSKCAQSFSDYLACTRRIEGDNSGQKHCTGQYFDYWSCIDKCVAPKLLSQLK